MFLYIYIEAGVMSITLKVIARSIKCYEWHVVVLDPDTDSGAGSSLKGVY